MEPLKYSPIGSLVDASFFHKLALLKLDQFMLTDTSQPISAFVTSPDRITKFNTIPLVLLDYLSFDSGSTSDNISIKGLLYNTNTVEEFKSLDKLAFLKAQAAQLNQLLILSSDLPPFGDISCFSLLTFSDLKKHNFYYWFAFPSLISSWEISNQRPLDGDIHSLTADDIIPPFKRDIFVGLDHSNTPVSSWKDASQYVFYNPSYGDLPSAHLKNYLYFLALKGVTSLKLTVVKGGIPSSSSSSSSSSSAIVYQLVLKDPIDPNSTPKVTGWERNVNGKLGPKLANLGALIDPHQLADQAVDLNLKLMKWRIAPELDLDKIKGQRVLLLGAGTLGSYVSRALMGWGVRKITFVDNGRVSYSNPVRQPLFKFIDCHSDEGQGELKAIQASRALKEIFPGVETEGHTLLVPMVGHPVSAKDEHTQRGAFETLERLFDDHDVIFLLMDSRESRWLPTVMGLSKGKLVLNAALGFDSYLVMRHGTLEGDSKGRRLGCYFCNDIVAPDDSLSGRTLDQMCTVTRPGVALMASSLAVELFASVMQHPAGRNAGAGEVEEEEREEEASNVLGEVPHQIRGFLHNFSQNKFKAPAFEQCSACSEAVVAGYRADGWQFVKKCLDDLQYLEQVSGLTALQEAAEAGAIGLMDDLDLSDDGIE